ncbi:hypothetical protein I8752_37130 [Nostocaceae cyanobacterium CENA369]|uniref:Uncharacterized protein n=1 Tax=Dendronalium phyllosphericum CENA369 TaxID=1725256 RepID=A0A8J7IMW8_9NOST|nr:hypothetical protein [Dendronalium phyllosphericum]MBH8578465.1 hypothetical protein [Dendronalium phyllosphericum CENA369]
MSKSTLNKITTILGLIAGGSTLLGGAGMINQGVAATVGGIATAILGYLVQQPAAGEQQPASPAQK